MKNTSAISIVFISIIVIIIISTFGDASTYVTFSKAKDVYESGSLTKFHVVGKLNKDEDNNIQGLMKSDDKMSFTFQMIDEDGMKEKVFYGEPMPPDFLLSEQVVVIGGYENNTFVADDILLKCPSKYTEENIKI
ncbi:MAG: cytochrome c maturation protein CcmE [Bacteroidota bacterium]|jgi:cytochrome c-type biogenesis protein CcmE|nr:cytochrome c maturation protein CcmE [Bacteroidota bacterium]MEC7851010.1 cytochrome c maturation protein CcmE [Bacteroidota bacterium]MEC8702894.1 cytochrome c maturation protein CcmE [Bacteroidota bacterium]|tara:strand:- start:1372 stop:1776 length:405 start_codon:yes stop_codon:yes gene_type:complete